jgi:uncharacterized protein (TIGR02466 family)
MLYNLFPLTVYKAKAGLSVETRKAIAAVVEGQYKKTTDPSRRTSSAWVGAMHGMLSIHLQKEFEPVVSLYPEHVKIYMEKLGYKWGELSIFVTRSWATYGNSNETILRHKHTSSALSIAYYVSLPEGSASISFETEAHQNEPITGLFTEARHRGLIDPTNTFAATAVNMEVEEDDLVIFPSSTLHGVMPSRHTAPRISIASDTLFLTKQVTNSEKVLPPVSNWRDITA